MNWMDSGGAGLCGDTEGYPGVLVEVEPISVVTLSQIKWGDT
jgi:hypothetical protein